MRLRETMQGLRRADNSQRRSNQIGLVQIATKLAASHVLPSSSFWEALSVKKIANLLR